MNNIECEKCGKLTPNHDLVHCDSMDQGDRNLCSACLNMDLAELAGFEAAHTFGGNLSQFGSRPRR